MILLTFNILNIHAETKDGTTFSEDELLEITQQNTKAILRILENHDIKSTFFVEISIAEKLTYLLENIKDKGHEIAFYNKGSKTEEIWNVKEKIEHISEKKVRGIRQKEVSVSLDDLKLLEFSYITNIENANVLFPFRRLIRDTEITEVKGISVVPESISPYSQIPYNDFVFQMVPMKYYQSMVTETLKNEEFCLIYLNSWQFTDFQEFNFKIPFYRKWNSGRKMEDKLENFLTWINREELATARMKDYIF